MPKHIDNSTGTSLNEFLAPGAHLSRPTLVLRAGVVALGLAFSIPCAIATEPPPDVVIDNLTYFRLIDGEVRGAMSAFEVKHMLPLAQKALAAAGLEQKYQKEKDDIVVEGYYANSPKLSQYFKILRVLQDHHVKPDDIAKVTDPDLRATVRKLHDVYSHEVFGIMWGKRATYVPAGAAVFDRAAPPGTLSPRADPVTLAFAGTERPDWQIATLFNRVDKRNLGSGLVGFAWLVDATSEGLGPYNPVATTMAMESTCLFRMKYATKGVPPRVPVDWQVTSEVEAFGDKVVAAYNDMMKMVSDDSRVIRISERNAGNKAIKLKDDDMIRIVNIAIDDTVKPKLYYHWGIVRVEGHPIGFKVIEKTDKRIIATSEWQKMSANEGQMVARTGRPQMAVSLAGIERIWPGLTTVEKGRKYKCKTDQFEFTVQTDAETIEYMTSFNMGGNSNVLYFTDDRGKRQSIELNEDTAEIRFAVDGDELRLYGKDYVDRDSGEVQTRDSLWARFSRGKYVAAGS